ncbi:MAG: hypothetical protein ACRCZI_04730 [Cetobacterium sp.]
MLPTEIYYEIFRYLRPNERMILNEVDCIKLYYQNFVKTTIWPKLFKSLTYCNPKCGIISNITFNLQIIEDNYYYYQVDSIRTHRYIDTFYSNTFCVFDYTNITLTTNKETIIDLPFYEEDNNKVLSHFIILGKNISKIELHDCNGFVYHNFYLTQDIVKFKLPDISMFMDYKIKIYADSVNKVYGKEYLIDDDVIESLRITYHMKIETYQNHKIHKYLLCSDGLTSFCQTYNKYMQYPHGF